MAKSKSPTRSREADRGQKAKTGPVAPSAPSSTAPGRREIHLEETPGGRAVMSAAATFLVLIMLLAGLPGNSALKDTTDDVVTGVVDLTGLTQSWALFAPNPSAWTRQLEAEMVYEDGTVVTWQPPPNGRFLAPYRTYRWRKWISRVLSDRFTSTHLPAAAWIARQHERDGAYPVEVTLTRLTYRAPDAGSGERRDPDPDWNETVYFRVLWPAGEVPDVRNADVVDLEAEEDENGGDE